MYKHLLVPTDGSELSAVAVRNAARLARALDARITLLHVQHSSHADAAPGNPPSGNATGHVESILASAAVEVERGGVPCERRVAISARPWEQIIGMAQMEDCDLIFMASHGRSGLAGIAGLVIGSETQKVLTHCTIPVLVYR